MPSDLVVGLVAEGVNDYRVFQPLIKETVARTSPQLTVLFRLLQPRSDATSSGYSGGGWTEVYKWCLRNPPNLRRSLVFQQVVEGTPACDLLVVHLDGDALRDFASKASIPLPNTPWTSSQRATFTESVIHEWLWPNGTQAEIDLPDRHIPVIAVWATETWIVAALDVAVGQPEEVDPVPLLIRQRADLEDNRRPGRLKKMDVGSIYDSLALDLIQELSRVRAVCSQLEKFCTSVERYLDIASPDRDD